MFTIWQKVYALFIYIRGRIGDFDKRGIVEEDYNSSLSIKKTLNKNPSFIKILNLKFINKNLPTLGHHQWICFNAKSNKKDAINLYSIDMRLNLGFDRIVEEYDVVEEESTCLIELKDKILDKINWEREVLCGKRNQLSNWN